MKKWIKNNQFVLSMMFLLLVSTVSLFISHWFISWILLFFGCGMCVVWILLEQQISRHKEEIIKKYKTILCHMDKDYIQQKELIFKYKDVLEQFCEYRRPMLDGMSVYSEMATNGVEAPVANTLIDFAKNLSPNCTILLMRIDHDQKDWAVILSGKSVYETQLSALFDRAKENLKDINSPVIIKKREMVN